MNTKYVLTVNHWQHLKYCGSICTKIVKTILLTVRYFLRVTKSNCQYYYAQQISQYTNVYPIFSVLSMIDWIIKILIIIMSSGSEMCSKYLLRFRNRYICVYAHLLFRANSKYLNAVEILKYDLWRSIVT